MVAQAVIDKIEERDRITGLVEQVARRVVELQVQKQAALAAAAARLRPRKTRQDPRQRRHTMPENDRAGRVTADGDASAPAEIGPGEVRAGASDAAAGAAEVRDHVGAVGVRAVQRGRPGADGGEGHGAAGGGQQGRRASGKRATGGRRVRSLAGGGGTSRLWLLHISPLSGHLLRPALRQMPLQPGAMESGYQTVVDNCYRESILASANAAATSDCMATATSNSNYLPAGADPTPRSIAEVLCYAT